MLLDDSRLLAEKMQKDGSTCDINIVPEMFHVFPLFPYFKESRKALAELQSRINTRLQMMGNFN